MRETIVLCDLKISRRALSRLVVANETELELLPFGQGLHAGTLDRGDMHKHIRAAIVRLDEVHAARLVDAMERMQRPHTLLVQFVGRD
jgi:hypothetical protein